MTLFRKFNMKVITFGSFDLLHIGHINILRRAKEFGDKLIVGVSTDALHFFKKKEYPVYNQDNRLKIVKAIRYVDEVFFEESLELKKEYILKYNADVLVMGDDWKGKFDWVSDVCNVIYLKRTPNISTTEIKNSIK